MNENITWQCLHKKKKLVQTHLEYLLNHSGIMRIALQTIRTPSPILLLCPPSSSGEVSTGDKGLEAASLT